MMIFSRNLFNFAAMSKNTESKKPMRTRKKQNNYGKKAIYIVITLNTLIIMSQYCRANHTMTSGNSAVMAE